MHNEPSVCFFSEHLALKKGSSKREDDLDEAEKESTEERDMATEQTVNIESDKNDKNDPTNRKAEQVAADLSEKAKSLKGDIDELAREADKLKSKGKDLEKE